MLHGLWKPILRDPTHASYDLPAPEPKSDPVTLAAAAPPLVTAPHSTGMSILTGILWLYVAVAAVLVLRLACGLVAALRLLKTAKPIALDAQILQSASLRLLCSARVASPVTICSSIVLPGDWASWDSEKLRIVLAHERSHIRQGDFYIQLLAGVYAAAVWFSPLGWWLKRTLSDLAEAISDRAGLEEAADRTSYAQILLEFAAAPRPTLIGVAMARSGSISRRIERFLNDVSFRQAFAGTPRALVALAVVPVALFAATALVRVEAAGQQSEQKAQVILPTTGIVTPEIVTAPQEPPPAPATPEQVEDDNSCPRNCAANTRAAGHSRGCGRLCSRAPRRCHLPLRMCQRSRQWRPSRRHTRLVHRVSWFCRARRRIHSR